MRYELAVRGGLGNQLFVILEAYRLYLLTEHPIILNLSEYDSSARFDRPFSASEILPQIMSDFTISIGLLARLRYIFLRVYSRFDRHGSATLRIPGDVQSSVLIPFMLRLKLGYYQNVDYSETQLKALSIIRKNYASQCPLRPINRLAVHVRRGDYLFKKHAMHGLILISDLLLECRHALANFSFEGITIFTDSPHMLELSCFELLGVNLVIDKGGKCTDVFNRMASHSGIIAANSTFSLWAGLLGSPAFFSIPEFWMPGIKSSRLGLPGLRRYSCTL